MQKDMWTKIKLEEEQKLCIVFWKSRTALQMCSCAINFEIDSIKLPCKAHPNWKAAT
jgi:hypothetical protein